MQTFAVRSLSKNPVSKDPRYGLQHNSAVFSLFDADLVKAGITKVTCRPAKTTTLEVSVLHI